MPILGIVDSAKTGNLVTNSYESIATQSVVSPTALITFSSIPSTYINLQVRIFAQSSTGGNQAYQMYFNNDTSLSSYAYNCFGGDGSSFTQNVLSQAHIGSNRSNAWNTTIVNIIDYTDTSKLKTRQSVSGSMSQTDGSCFYYGGIWNNTSAVNRIDFANTAGANFITGSVFALYGMKGV
jgi:hypothetical protein